MIRAVTIEGTCLEHEAHGALRRAEVPAGLDFGGRRQCGVGSGDAINGGVELGGAAGVLDVVGRRSLNAASIIT